MHGNVEEWTSSVWSSDGFYASCSGVTRGGHFAAGNGHGYLSTLPFMRQPKTCTAFDDDLSASGVRLVLESTMETAVGASSWGSVKTRTGH